MTVDVVCSNCNKRTRLPDKAVGKRIKCPKCQAVINVPAATASVEPAIELWHLKDYQGQTFGPVSRADPDIWQAAGRLNAASQVLRDGAGQWQWATDLYPQLAMPAAPAKKAPVKEPQSAPANEGLSGVAVAPESPPAVLHVKTSSAVRRPPRASSLTPIFVAFGAVASLLAGLTVVVTLWATGFFVAPEKQEPRKAVAHQQRAKPFKPEQQVAKKEPPKSVTELVAAVNDVSTSNVEAYDKFLNGKTLLDTLLFESGLTKLKAHIAEIKRLGLENEAVAVLLNAIQANENSTNKKDLLICAQAIRALGELELGAKAAVPKLTELTRHQERYVSIRATTSIEQIQDRIDEQQLRATDPESYQDRQQLQGTWTSVSSAITGGPTNEPNTNATFTFAGGRIRMTGKGLSKSCHFVLRSSKRPKEIDLIDDKEGDNLFGLYEFADDTLVICFGKQKPKGLTIQGESFVVLFKLKKKEAK